MSDRRQFDEQELKEGLNKLFCERENVAEICGRLFSNIGSAEGSIYHYRDGLKRYPLNSYWQGKADELAKYDGKKVQHIENAIEAALDTIRCGIDSLQFALDLMEEEGKKLEETYNGYVDLANHVLANNVLKEYKKEFETYSRK